MFVVRSPERATVYTPAKLNLHLEVLARRSDGYHELETLMTAIDLFDTLVVSSDLTGAIRLGCRWALGWSARNAAPLGDVTASLGDLPPASENIVTRAVERLRKRAGLALGAQIELVKRIPSAAGLGGASSDAAAALVGANEVWSLGWSPAQLAEVAAEVGSDVPFFLGVGRLGCGSAVCRGRGERIEPAKGMTRLNYVVVRPPEGLSTPLVFRHCRPAEAPCDSQSIVAAARRGDPTRIARCLMNRLEGPAAGLSPWIEKLTTELQRVGAVGSRMSGSGTSCFGIFRTARHARRAASRLQAARLGAVHAAATAAAPRRRGTTSSPQ